MNMISNRKQNEEAEHVIVLPAHLSSGHGSNGSREADQPGKCRAYDQDNSPICLPGLTLDCAYYIPSL